MKMQSNLKTSTQKKRIARVGNLIGDNYEYNSSIISIVQELNSDNLKSNDDHQHVEMQEKQKIKNKKALNNAIDLHKRIPKNLQITKKPPLMQKTQKSLKSMKHHKAYDKQRAHMSYKQTENKNGLCKEYFTSNSINCQLPDFKNYKIPKKQKPDQYESKKIESNTVLKQPANFSPSLKFDRKKVAIQNNFENEKFINQLNYNISKKQNSSAKKRNRVLSDSDCENEEKKSTNKKEKLDLKKSKILDDSSSQSDSEQFEKFIETAKKNSDSESNSSSNRKTKKRTKKKRKNEKEHKGSENAEPYTSKLRSKKCKKLISPIKTNCSDNLETEINKSSILSSESSDEEISGGDIFHNSDQSDEENSKTNKSEMSPTITSTNVMSECAKKTNTHTQNIDATEKEVFALTPISNMNSTLNKDIEMMNNISRQSTTSDMTTSSHSATNSTSSSVSSHEIFMKPVKDSVMLSECLPNNLCHTVIENSISQNETTQLDTSQSVEFQEPLPIKIVSVVSLGNSSVENEVNVQTLKQTVPFEHLNIAEIRNILNTKGLYSCIATSDFGSSIDVNTQASCESLSMNTIYNNLKTEIVGEYFETTNNPKHISSMCTNNASCQTDLDSFNPNEKIIIPRYTSASENFQNSHTTLATNKNLQNRNSKLFPKDSARNENAAAYFTGVEYSYYPNVPNRSIQWDFSNINKTPDTSTAENMCEGKPKQTVLSTFEKTEAFVTETIGNASVRIKSEDISDSDVSSTTSSLSLNTAISSHSNDNLENFSCSSSDLRVQADNRPNSSEKKSSFKAHINPDQKIENNQIGIQSTSKNTKSSIICHSEVKSKCSTTSDSADDLDVVVTGYIMSGLAENKSRILQFINLYLTVKENYRDLKNAARSDSSEGMQLMIEKEEKKLTHLRNSIKNMCEKDPCFHKLLNTNALKDEKDQNSSTSSQDELDEVVFIEEKAVNDISKKKSIENLTERASPSTSKKLTSQKDIDSIKMHKAARLKKCAVCGNKPKLACEKCKEVFYCSQKCAETFWHKEHYKVCVRE